ncbi:hypothetical protein LEP1GSC188_2041 [Leptospira weilii serovar Topaz str. LT2116]|uniref:Uncharacterized protein n=1 Tax=Leptospira weilii serovar Topaz str. LT2116 TaxID=1088540 RepID=M3FSS2_9LEPT|nr:hypothetical protein LEP1GSC188_2041 [Leptospira weilii serovar Topaz str. LT2116]
MFLGLSVEYRTQKAWSFSGMRTVANQISNLGFTKLAANLEIKLSLKFIFR